MFDVRPTRCQQVAQALHGCLPEAILRKRAAESVVGDGVLGCAWGLYNNVIVMGLMVPRGIWAHKT